MKVIRLKRGYRIRLSDAEMGLVQGLVQDGVMMREGDDNALASYTAQEKAALTRRAKVTGLMGLLSTDEDRRLVTEAACENCGDPVDEQSAAVREWLGETGEAFCDACVEEGRDAESAYAEQEAVESDDP